MDEVDGGWIDWWRWMGDEVNRLDQVNRLNRNQELLWLGRQYYSPRYSSTVVGDRRRRGLSSPRHKKVGTHVRVVYLARYQVVAHPLTDEWSSV